MLSERNAGAQTVSMLQAGRAKVSIISAAEPVPITVVWQHCHSFEAIAATSRIAG
jgi:hypothetical protein